MANGKESNIILSLALFAVMTASDQLSKYMIRSNGGFYICNTNLAFGLKPSYFLILVSALTVAISLASVGNYKSQAPNIKQIQNYNSQNPKRFLILNFGHWNLFEIRNFGFGILLIVSGAISNIIDRILYGCVLDFIDLKFWPVFNLADVYITMGSLAVIIRLLRKKQQESKASY